MTEIVDTQFVVVGTGLVGSAALWRLAARLAPHGSSPADRVVGLEQFDPPHQLGSSHGQTRIFRTAVFEGPTYVEFARRALALWQELEIGTGRSVIQLTGGLMIGSDTGEVFSGARAVAERFGLAHEIVADRAELTTRYPQHRFAETDVVLVDPDAGVLFPEEAISAALSAGRNNGARLLAGTRAERVHIEDSRVVVEAGDVRLRARCAVVAAGSWTNHLLPDLGLPLEVHRAVMSWYRPRDRQDQPLWEPDRFPIFVRDTPGASGWGIPDVHGTGVKLDYTDRAPRETVDPDANPASVAETETVPTQAFCAAALPGLAPTPVRTQPCMTTHTPDGDFVVGIVHDDPRVVVLAGFSGHGAKHAAAVGDVGADLALDGSSSIDLTSLSPTRFGRSGSWTQEAASR